MIWGRCVSDSRARLVIAQNANLAKFNSQNSAKSKKSVKTHDIPSNLGFLNPKVKGAFIELNQIFIKAPM